MTTCVLRCRHITCCDAKYFATRGKLFPARRVAGERITSISQLKNLAPRVPSMRHAFLMRSRRSFSERWASPVTCSPPSRSRKGWVMGSASAFAWLNVSNKGVERSCSTMRVPGQCRFNALPIPVAAILLGLGSSANAQAIPWANGEFASPWNAQRIFEPSSLPDRTDPENRE